MATAPLLLCTRDDVLQRFNGDSGIAQLLNNGSNLPNYTTLDRAIEDASAEIAAACGNNYKIWTAANDVPAYVRRLAVNLAIYWCWYYGTHGKAVPEEVKAQYEKALAQADKIEKGQRGLGNEPNPKARRAGRIDNSDCGRRAVYSTWRRAGYLGAR